MDGGPVVAAIQQSSNRAVVAVAVVDVSIAAGGS
jgi:hypothetical protein